MITLLFTAILEVGALVPSLEMNKLRQRGAAMRPSLLVGRRQNCVLTLGLHSPLTMRLGTDQGRGS